MMAISQARLRPTVALFLVAAGRRNGTERFIAVTLIGPRDLEAQPLYVLFPSLAVMLFVTWRAYRQYARARTTGGSR